MCWLLLHHFRCIFPVHNLLYLVQYKQYIVTETAFSILKTKLKSKLVPRLSLGLLLLLLVYGWSTFHVGYLLW
jgi:hypothetical protein